MTLVVFPSVPILNHPFPIPCFSASASRLGLSSYNPTGALNQSSTSAGLQNLVLPDGSLLPFTHTPPTNPAQISVVPCLAIKILPPHFSHAHHLTGTDYAAFRRSLMNEGLSFGPSAGGPGSQV